MNYLFRLFRHFHVFVQYMIEQGALTINGIQDIAATTIQKCWRGYEVRKEFNEHRKDLIVKHYKGIRKRASAAEQRRTEDLLGNQSSRSVSPRYNFGLLNHT